MLLLNFVRFCSSVAEEVFAVTSLLARPKAVALDGDLCAASRAFFCGQEDNGDCVELVHGSRPGDGKSQRFFHWLTVQRDTASFARQDDCVPQAFARLS